MTQSPAHDTLNALLITLPERPLCRTLGCPGCELPQLTPDLLPPPILAYLQLKELLARHRKARRGSPAPQGRVTQSSVTLLAARRMRSGHAGHGLHT